MASHQQPWLFPELERLHLPKLKYDTRLYASASEAKCSEALQKYIPGWMPVWGKTIQIDIGNHRAVDFKVGNTLVEFHPICIWREMDSINAQAKFAALYKGMTTEQKAAFREAMADEQEMQYKKKRKMALEACLDRKLRECKLVICKDEVQFYAKVLVPYAKQAVPSPVNWVKWWRG